MTTVVADRPPIAANPWRAMWFSPRRAMRAILDAERRPSRFPLVALCVSHLAVDFLFLVTAAADMAKALLAVAVLALIIAASVGYVLNYGPYVLTWAGRRHGGIGTPKQVREALIWSWVPIAVVAVCWLPVTLTVTAVAILAPSLIASPRFSIHETMGFLTVAAFCWSLTVSVGAVAEALRVSTYRALDGLAMVYFPFIALLLLAMDR